MSVPSEFESLAIVCVSVSSEFESLAIVCVSVPSDFEPLAIVCVSVPSEFESLAIRVLDECHNTDPDKAIMLVEKRSPTWSDLTCLQVAASAGDQVSFRQTSWQMKTLKHMLSVGCPFRTLQRWFKLCGDWMV